MISYIKRFFLKGDKIQEYVLVGFKRRFIFLFKEGYITATENFQIFKNTPNIQSAKINHM